MIQTKNWITFSLIWPRPKSIDQIKIRNLDPRKKIWSKMKNPMISWSNDLDNLPTPTPNRRCNSYFWWKAKIFRPILKKRLKIVSSFFLLMIKIQLNIWMIKIQAWVDSILWWAKSSSSHWAEISLLTRNFVICPAAAKNK